MATFRSRYRREQIERTREEAEPALRRIVPFFYDRPPCRTTHFIMFEGVEIPTKQAAAAIAGWGRNDCWTAEADPPLAELGFEIRVRP